MIMAGIIWTLILKKNRNVVNKDTDIISKQKLFYYQ